MFSKLPDYLEWANGRCLSSFESLDAPDGRLRSRLGHVLAAEEHWFTRLGGGETELPVWPELSTSDLRTLIVRNAGTCRSILRSGERAMTEWIVSYTNAQGDRFENRASDIMMHVLAHGAYHRGQIAASVKQLGGHPASTDYIVFCRES